MSNLDELAKAAEEAEAANVHDRPVTDADLGETAADGAQVVVEGEAPAAPVNPAPVMQPAPEMQLPQPVATPVDTVPPAPVVTVQTPASAAAPAPLPTERAEPLTPFNDQITNDTAPTPVAPAMQVPHPETVTPAQPLQPVQQQPLQPAQPMAEQPSAPPAPGTMPGQTVRPQTQTQATTPASHIITESYPHPTPGGDPMGGIAV